mmetsp:Transcript_72667/g.84405  ORF Transcript_72667/g.84405 Transcript_72667/m.84405 type:complete len:517 (+) Transcript_72667:52-1602(+)
MFGKLLVGACCGLAAAPMYRSSSTCHADAPTLNAIMDPRKDVPPINCVVIGGGYSGSKVAYQLDSIFNVTLIDTKNFCEITSDIIPIISSPWSEKNEDACRKLQVLHRYYLKRANVLTGVANHVSDTEVSMSDGRTVPYDILVVATGEKKAFPFSTKQKTVSGRVAELKAFNQFLGTSKQVAIVGAGPMGVSLAAQLSEDRPELQVHLFHSSGTILPNLPDVAQDYALQHLRKCKNVTLHLAEEVTGITTTPATDAQAAAKALVSSTSNAPLSGSSWFSRLFRRNEDSSRDSVVIPEKFHLDVNHLEYEPKPVQSIVSQIYFGKRNELGASRVVATETIRDFDYVFNVGGDTPQPIESGLLSSHLSPDTHLKVSTLMQVFDHHNIFVVGRCNNLPWCRGLGSSDLQARALFRMMNSIVNSTNPKLLTSSDGLRLDRLVVPRLLVKLGNTDACGSTPWSGSMTGVNALREFIQDRGHLQREFISPIFYKQQDPARVHKRVTEWKLEDMTDITDFSHS